MSEYMKDAGHRPMQTCDRCHGAFYCGVVPSGAEAPDWMCPRCTESVAEIARLQREVEHHLDEMNLQARWTREAQEKVELLRAALKPFAELSSVYVRRAETFGWKDADGVFGAADITKDVTIRVADCRAALKALGDSGLTE